MHPDKLTVRTLFPLPCKNLGISHICVSVCRNMRADGIDLKLFTPRVAINQACEGFIDATLPRIASVIPFRMINKWVGRMTEERFVRSVSPGSVAYLWSDCTVELFRRLKEAGVRVVREKYNCHVAVSKKILDEAYERIGLAPGHSITDAWIMREREQLELTDMVCCPSPMVAESMIAQGVSRSHLINSSYGWSPQRFAACRTAKRRGDELTIVFVGSVCVRKGAHLLLDAWSRADIDGRLVLVGTVEPAVAEKYAAVLNREDVVVTGFVSDPGPLFHAADIFAFPSLEEGDPLVTYEAAAHALPIIVSPMGAGRGVRNGIEGMVLEPYDCDAWVNSLRQLAGDAELRRHYGHAARRRAQQFTWEHVGQRLGNEFLTRFGSLDAVAPVASESIVVCSA